MSITSHILPWMGFAVRHVPSDAPFGVLDFAWAGKISTNRWNAQGEPTIYLAKDVNVALAEYACHYSVSRPGLKPGRETKKRQVYRLGIDLGATLSLCDPAVQAALAIPDVPTCFLDIPKCRSIAKYLRTVVRVQGIFVPSVALLDIPDEWNLVLFLENLPEGEPPAFITSVEDDGPFEV